MSKSIIYLLIKHYHTQDTQWYMAAESIINMIFSVIIQPEISAHLIIKKIALALFSNLNSKSHPKT